MNFFKKKTSSVTQASIKMLLDSIEKIEKIDVSNLLYQPKSILVDYLPITIEMILKFKRPDHSSEKLLLYKVLLRKNFTLLIIEIPWEKDTFKLSPLIIENSTGKITGLMLPFGELSPSFSSQQNKEMSELGTTWAMFVMEHRFK